MNYKYLSLSTILKFHGDFQKHTGNRWANLLHKCMGNGEANATITSLRSQIRNSSSQHNLLVTIKIKMEKLNSSG